MKKISRPVAAIFGGNNSFSRIWRGVGAVLVAATLITSCNEPDQLVKPPVVASQPASLEPLKQYLSSVTGAPVQKIVFDESEQEFVVDGDMLFSKKEAELQYAASQSGKTAQRRALYLLNESDITIYIHPDVPSNWRAAAKLAIPSWNTVSGTRLFMREVNSASQADLIIIKKYQVPNPLKKEETEWVARQAYPTMSGNIGGAMKVNSYYEDEISLSASRKRNAIVHELGHAIGLSHTDVPSKNTIDFQVCGTPTLDPASVMHSTEKSWTGFTEYDKLAVQTMYPHHAYKQLPGSVRDISARLWTNKELWAIGNTPVTGGYSVHKFNYTSNKWDQVGSSTSIKGGVKISIGQDGTPWIVDNLGLVYRRVNGGWLLQGGAANDIVVGPNTTYILTKKATLGGYAVAYRTGNTWKEIPGPGGVKIAVTTQGTPWLIDNTGRILKYSAAGTFGYVTGTATDIAAGPDGSMFTLGTQNVFGGHPVRQFKDNCWMQVGALGGKKLAVHGNGGGPVLVDNEGVIYEW